MAFSFYVPTKTAPLERQAARSEINLVGKTFDA
jgi:hypothetical protein